MAACGGLQHIFEKPSPESQTLFDSLSSLKRTQSVKSLDDSASSFTEIFGELHFREKQQDSSPHASSSASSVLTEESSTEKPNDKSSPRANYFQTTQMRRSRHRDSFSSMNSDSLSLCTEGLGSESFDCVEDSKVEIESTSNDWAHPSEGRTACAVPSKNVQFQNFTSVESKRSRISGAEFPPPISCIGRSGKPWVCFKSFWNNGRFILKEVRVPTQEFLHASREDGRLKLQFIQSDDERIDEEEMEKEDTAQNWGGNKEVGEGVEGNEGECTNEIAKDDIRGDSS